MTTTTPNTPSECRAISVLAAYVYDPVTNQHRSRFQCAGCGRPHVACGATR